MNRSPSWYVKHVVHNCLAHPLLSLAELFVLARFNKLASIFFKFHDATIPSHDAYNVKRFYDKN